MTNVANNPGTRETSVWSHQPFIRPTNTPTIELSNYDTFSFPSSVPYWTNEYEKMDQAYIMAKLYVHIGMNIYQGIFPCYLIQKKIKKNTHSHMSIL